MKHSDFVQDSPQPIKRLPGLKPAAHSRSNNCCGRGCMACWFHGWAENVEKRPDTPVISSAIPITDGPAKNLFPSLSPDGKSLIYANGLRATWTFIISGWKARDPII